MSLYDKSDQIVVIHSSRMSGGDRRDNDMGNNSHEGVAERRGSFSYVPEFFYLVVMMSDFRPFDFIPFKQYMPPFTILFKTTYHCCVPAICIVSRHLWQVIYVVLCWKDSKEVLNFPCIWLLYVCALDVRHAVILLLSQRDTILSCFEYFSCVIICYYDVDNDCCYQTLWRTVHVGAKNSIFCHRGRVIDRWTTVW